MLVGESKSARGPIGLVFVVVNYGGFWNKKTIPQFLYQSIYDLQDKLRIFKVNLARGTVAPTWGTTLLRIGWRENAEIPAFDGHKNGLQRFFPLSLEWQHIAPLQCNIPVGHWNVFRRSDTVQTKIMKSKYSSAAGTAYVTYENCIVPKKCLGRSNMAGNWRWKSGKPHLGNMVESHGVGLLEVCPSAS
jgi:hypothetical protein